MTRRHKITLWMAAVCIFLPACSALAGPDGGGLEVNVRTSALSLTNNAHETVYTFLVERETAALLNWAPCSDPETCDGIEPEQTRTVPFTAIMGWTDEAEEVIVYWWHLIANDDGGFSPDSIRGVVVSVE